MRVRQLKMTAQQQKCVESIIVCLVAHVVNLAVLPLFYKATGTFSDSGLPGLAVTGIGASASVWAFLRCPSRPLAGKLAVLTLMSIALLIGLHEWLVQARGILY